jgi:hypothetical protein
MELSLPPKLVKQKNCIFGFVKFSFPVTRLMPYYASKLPVLAPYNHITLRIPLMATEKLLTSHSTFGLRMVVGTFWRPVELVKVNQLLATHMGCGTFTLLSFGGFALPLY